MPPPKAMWRLTSRSKRTTSASGNSASSVLAEPIMTMTWSPSWIGQPASSVSSHRDPGHAHDRRLPAQELLDGVGDDVGVLDELAPLLGVLGQEGEHAVEGGGDRVEPGDEEEEADVEDVLAGEPVALDLGVEEVRQEVVASLHLALVEDLVEVLVDRVGDLLLVVAGLLRSPYSFPVTWSGRMMPSFMVRKRSSSSRGRPEQGEEDLRGERDGELLGEVDLAPVDEAVDEVVDERRHLVVHGAPSCAGRRSGRAACGTSCAPAGRSAAGSSAACS